MNLLNFDCVLLDMDGTLLDGHFDDLFWNDWVAQAYADKTGLDLSSAQKKIQHDLQGVADQMPWYDFDGWATHFELDLLQLQGRGQSLIRCRQGTIAFLDHLKDHGIPMILATNAHPVVLAFKLDAIQSNHPEFTAYFSDIISSHSFGLPKETRGFWQQLTERTNIDPARTALIDDNPSVLAAAKAYGLAGVIAINQPNSKKPSQSVPGYQNVCFLNELIKR